MISLKTSMIIGGFSFLFGFITGEEVTRRWMGYNHLQQELADARAETELWKKESEKLVQQVKTSAKIEDKAIKVDTGNREIVREVIKEVLVKEPAPPCVCVSAASMCKLGLLQAYKSRTATIAKLGEKCGEADGVALVGEAETTELIARLRESELRNVRAVWDCKVFYRQLQRRQSGK